MATSLRLAHAVLAADVLADRLRGGFPFVVERLEVLIGPRLVQRCESRVVPFDEPGPLPIARGIPGELIFRHRRIVPPAQPGTKPPGPAGREGARAGGVPECRRWRPPRVGPTASGGRDHRTR